MNIIKEVKKLKFPRGEYVVVGSGILSVLNLRKAKDIDIAVTAPLLKKLRASGRWKEVIRYNKVFLERKKVDIITRLNWNKYSTTTAKAIKTAVIIDGVYFLNIRETIKFKTALGRAKDFRDIKLLKKYLLKNKK